MMVIFFFKSFFHEENLWLKNALKYLIINLEYIRFFKVVHKADSSFFCYFEIKQIALL